MWIIRIALIFWAVYLLVGLFFAFKQKKAHDKERKQTIKTEGLVEPDIYDADYYLNKYAGSQKGYLTNLDKLPVSLGRCFAYAEPKAGENALDIGCGRGELAYHCVLNGCSATAIDYSRDAIELANMVKDALPEDLRGKMAVKKIDFGDLDTKEKYDVIFIADLLEHLTDLQLEQLFWKTKQILKEESGRVIIHTSPNKTWINIIFPLKDPIIQFTQLTQDYCHKKTDNCPY